MNSDMAIRVENLEKKYLLHHQAERGHKNYRALRDVLADTAARSIRRLRGQRGNSSTREEFWALRDVSFEVKRGDAVAIIGRNGAGKSTLLKLLSRITSPTGGSIELEGRVASLLEVGTGFHPELTGRENIFLNGAIIGMSRAEIRRKFDEIVAFAEVEKFLDTPVKRYSSGMYVRLAFAVAAHLESEILIVDEVLAVGDGEFQKKCLGKMSEARSSDRTVLFVSHNMAAVQQLCTSGIMLEKGVVVGRGPIDQVVNQYLKTAGQAEAFISLESRSRPSGRDVRVELLALEVNQGRPIFFGGPCEFTLTARTTTKIDKLCFEIGFSALDGVRYATYDSLTGGLREISSGTFDLHLTIPEVLVQPALYTLDLGIHSGGSGLDYLTGVTQIEILPSTVSPSYRTGGAYGLTLRGDWELR
jgi:lipopolysaccharide transport system ATP-binding protein